MKAYIFDLDGTLFDSMDVWQNIDVEFLQKRGINIPSNYAASISSMSFHETAVYTIRHFGLPDSVESIKKEWIDMAAHAYGHTVRLKPYAKEYLLSLHGKGAKLAVATGLFTGLIELALRNNGIYDLFDVICTTDETGCGKSRPDVFLLAADRLGVPPCECTVFEDIFDAVKSAKSTGMTVYGVYDKSSHNDWEKIKAVADYSIYDFKELLI